MSRKGITMSLAEAENHQRKHGFLKGGDASCLLHPSGTASNGAPTSNPKGAPKPRQNKTEAEFGLILEAQKRRGEILDYRPFGIKLEWGCDPVTGKPQVYSPDFTVFNVLRNDDGTKRVGAVIAGAPIQTVSVTLIEVKGYIYPQDLIRWKGCRSDWPMFRFELHQKSEGTWRRLF